MHYFIYPSGYPVSMCWAPSMWPTLIRSNTFKIEFQLLSLQACSLMVLKDSVKRKQGSSLRPLSEYVTTEKKMSVFKNLEPQVCKCV